MTSVYPGVVLLFVCPLYFLRSFGKTENTENGLPGKFLTTLIFLSDMKTLMKDKKQNKKLWLRRPLTRDMALYAAFDVETLIPIRDEMDK
jgi:hypothetical protein